VKDFFGDVSNHQLLLMDLKKMGLKTPQNVYRANEKSAPSSQIWRVDFSLWVRRKNTKNKSLCSYILS